MHVKCYDYYRETVEDCGIREILEETGLTLKDVNTECILNVVWLSEERHFVAVVLHGVVDDTKQKEPDTLEPHKCEGIRCQPFWFAFVLLHVNTF